MRTLCVIFSVIGFICLVYTVWATGPLLELLIEDGLADAIHYNDIRLADYASGQAQHIIPRIIHQTYKDETIPEFWEVPRESCVDMHPDYQYIFWTDDRARTFIAEKYPWFLDIFDSYPYPIQRADVIRYFILAHFGGIYIDLDNACDRRLDPLLSFPAWLRQTTPTGISNDVMGSIPRHPFFIRVIDELRAYNRNWLLPYITVMYSTGPLFLSVIWRQYAHGIPSSAANIRILIQKSEDGDDMRFFTKHLGNSWHAQDAKMIIWMGRHLALTSMVIILVAVMIGFRIHQLYKKRSSCRLISFRRVRGILIHHMHYFFFDKVLKLMSNVICPDRVALTDEEKGKSRKVKC